MLNRQVVRVGSIVWAVIGLAIGISSLGAVNRDARALVAAAAVLGSLAALLASFAVDRLRPRLAGVLLVFSVITPTFFAWILNVPALLVGILLVVMPSLVSSRTATGRSKSDNAAAA